MDKIWKSKIFKITEAIEAAEMKSGKMKVFYKDGQPSLINPKRKGIHSVYLDKLQHAFSPVSFAAE